MANNPCRQLQYDVIDNAELRRISLCESCILYVVKDIMGISLPLPLGDVVRCLRAVMRRGAVRELKGSNDATVQ